MTKTMKRNNKYYYKSKNDEIIDEEWDIAEKTGKPQTWWVYPNYKFEPHTRFVKCYTPALAEVVRKRTGWKIEPFI